MAQQAYAKSSAACPIHNTPYCCEVDDYLAIDPADLRHARHAVHLILRPADRAKGVDVLLEAFARVADKLPDATLSFLGTGPLKDALTARVDPRDRVTFAGFHPVAELPPYFARADLFVLPSRHDGWGVVINQAISAGLPVVASDAVGAAAELVRPDENGYVVPAGDAAVTCRRDAPRARLAGNADTDVASLSPARPRDSAVGDRRALGASLRRGLPRARILFSPRVGRIVNER